MDPNILAIAMAGPPGQDQGPRRRGASNAVLERARKASIERRQQKRGVPRMDREGLTTTILCIPAAAPMLKVSLPQKDKDMPLRPMCRLAVSPRVRGIVMM